MDPRIEDAIACGVDLFNQGRYFECHEVWEIAWKELAGEKKLCLQGLIQAAVALLHRQRGNRRGAESVYHKARIKLAACPPDLMGFQIKELVARLDRIFDSRCGQSDPPQLRRLENSGARNGT